MAVIINEIITEPGIIPPMAAEPRDVANEPRDRAPSMEDLRFEMLRDAQRKARIWVD